MLEAVTDSPIERAEATKIIQEVLAQMGLSEDNVDEESTMGTEEEHLVTAVQAMYEDGVTFDVDGFREMDKHIPYYLLDSKEAYEQRVLSDKMNAYAEDHGLDMNAVDNQISTEMAHLKESRRAEPSESSLLEVLHKSQGVMKRRYGLDFDDLDELRELNYAWQELDEIVAGVKTKKLPTYVQQHLVGDDEQIIKENLEVDDLNSAFENVDDIDWDVALMGTSMDGVSINGKFLVGLVL